MGNPYHCNTVCVYMHLFYRKHFLTSNKAGKKCALPHQVARWVVQFNCIDPTYIFVNPFFNSLDICMCGVCKSAPHPFAEKHTGDKSIYEFLIATKSNRLWNPPFRSAGIIIHRVNGVIYSLLINFIVDSVHKHIVSLLYNYNYVVFYFTLGSASKWTYRYVT